MYIDISLTASSLSSRYNVQKIEKIEMKTECNCISSWQGVRKDTYYVERIRSFVSYIQMYFCIESAEQQCKIQKVVLYLGSHFDIETALPETSMSYQTIYETSRSWQLRQTLKRVLRCKSWDCECVSQTSLPKPSQEVQLTWGHDE